MPISGGTSLSHGADRKGPAAVIKSMVKMDQIKSGGILLNRRFLPDVYRDLLVRVAGYSDYFIDLDMHHQEEIIARTGQGSF